MKVTSHLSFDVRSALKDAEYFKRAVIEKLFCNSGKFPEVATRHDFYVAFAYVVRDILIHNWIRTAHAYFEKNSRTVVYLSAEYLPGPHLLNNLIYLGIDKIARKAAKKLGLSFDEIIAEEIEPGLGNGGLGRLAACIMDSLASLQIPAIGYGLRYEFGIFSQVIRDGWQIEVSDKWLYMGNPWEIAHPEITYDIPFGGRTEQYYDEKGCFKVRWIPSYVIRGMAYDALIPGYKVKTTNLLRLWKAEACETFDFQAFNVGDYYRAVEQKIASENITKVLYPNDQKDSGKKLRLEQQYFFVACSLRDMIRIYLQKHKTLKNFHLKYAIQLNDTHPALAVAELMRILVDEYDHGWDEAWHITSNTFSYTNHTLLPEALEKWPLPLFSAVLPRHMEIIFEINRRFLEKVRALFPHDNEKLANISLIEESNEKNVRMANLACVGSKFVNGVSLLHSDLLRRTVLKDFNDIWPQKFCNVTNGISYRRFVLVANNPLAKLISDVCGEKWIAESSLLRRLEPLANDKTFLQKWAEVKRNNKISLAVLIKEKTGIQVDPDSMFDCHVKRIHEYKRQHLNVLRILAEFLRIKNGIDKECVPRTYIFAGTAAPGYYMAKLIIKLIHKTAELIRADKRASKILNVVFIPDFNISSGQVIYSAADLSEQISTAGKEASGTGNMKFAINGALTIGTLDGANIEIREAVGHDNFFLFGLTVGDVISCKAKGYNPMDIYNSDEDLRNVIDFLSSDLMTKGDSGLFLPILRSLLERDDYMVMADFRSYLNRQRDVSELYREKTKWLKSSVITTSRMANFSSDRVVREYNKKIWHASYVKV